MHNSEASAAEKASPRCWVCGGSELRLAKPANLPRPLDSEAFRITDSHYGVTAEIHRCMQCGFMQCPHVENAESFYADLEDPDYEEGRQERALQERRLLESAGLGKSRGRLLDVGAGSGILVEQAMAMGFDAEGIEPSRWLQEQAARHGLPVYRGVLPHEKAQGLYDVITLVDVIEHVTEPVAMLRQVEQLLSAEGRILIVTPDVGSVVARLLGWKWWHFRVAHIGYFNRQTLLLALKQAGLRAVRIARPAWYFRTSYLQARVNHYLWRRLQFRLPRRVEQMVVPLNLRDSLAVIAARSNDHRSFD